ncbi:CPBP family intramembrane glutamic endopeptidase [Priestia koreensis]|uniref:CAAX prenyl protease 2/Lysostaphin resistance protein A-like domain-containing protein n=1 Tax=Priestia koreensis TaxID=284581 RepID=A0A0M0L5T4_9BACI|nr:CPBP family intramembrane glutamic endopeptidase [Priestia koreensis]KOO46436.1 hypothetical protein AMD01_11445 [Priestia koreensis]
MKKPLTLVLTYCILVFGSTTLLNLTHTPFLVTISQLTPLFSTFFVFIFWTMKKDFIKEIGIFRLGSLKSYLYGFLACVPIIISFLIAWSLGYIDLPSVDRFPTWLHGQQGRFWFILQHSLSAYSLLSLLLFSFGEEIGWRGLLHTQLLKVVSTKMTVLLTSLLWLLFHLPFYLNGYNESGTTSVNIMLFSFMIVPLSIVMGWVRLQTKSIWPLVIFHASINFSRSLLEQLFYSKKDGWELITGESGIISIMIWILIAIPLWNVFTKNEKGMKKTKTKTLSIHAQKP